MSSVFPVWHMVVWFIIIQRVAGRSWIPRREKELQRSILDFSRLNSSVFLLLRFPILPTLFDMSDLV